MFKQLLYLKPKGWYKSVYLHQSIDENEDPLPWFTYAATHFIKQKLKLRPMKVFEFGSGNSTLWFSSRVQSIISMEHKTKFYVKMQPKFDLIDNVLYKKGKLDHSYSSVILDYENEFDIVIIDGGERVKCVMNCIKALKPDGIIIFDNSNVEKFNEAYRFLEKHNFKKIDFKGLAPIVPFETQTTIYYRENNCFNI